MWPRIWTSAHNWPRRPGGPAQKSSRFPSSSPPGSRSTRHSETPHYLPKERPPSCCGPWLTTYDALVGGSFLCRDNDGHVRNAYFAADATGMIGRHDKDLPTMWENAFYIGGQDDGVFRAGTLNVGAAVCWELMRTRTARRMRAHVDLVMTGSGWWSIPPWRPRATFAAMERRNRQTARSAAATFAKYVGAPVVHAAHAGAFRCAMPWIPLEYRGHFEGSTLITDGTGSVVAERRPEEGPGIVLGDIHLGRRPPVAEIPDRFWLHSRGALPTAAWHYQRWHGRRWYRRNMVTT